MDGRVLAYLVAISIGTGLLFGLAPALRLSRPDVNIALKDGGHGATRGPGGMRLATFLVAGQIALALVLLAGAGILIRSVLNVYMADPGVRTANVLTSFLALPDARYHSADMQIAFFERLEARLNALPGVESTAIADRFPTQGARRLPYEIADAVPVDGRARQTVSALTVGPGYFRTLSAAVLSGREFTDADGRADGPVVIVNQRFANQRWPGENPLGKRLRLIEAPTPEAWRTVVGVVSNIVQNDTTRQQFDPLVYVPYRQAPAAGMWVFARTEVPPGGLAGSLRGAVHSMDSELALFDVLALTERLADGYRSNESFGGVFLIFAAIALLLASVGLYALIAHAVSARTQEIGIRVAMGATARDVLALVLRQGMRPVGIGLAVGLAASLAITPVVRFALVQVSPVDPLTLAVATVVLTVSATLGCVVPACRATRVDPVVALRHD
jgi:predicted permease